MNYEVFGKTISCDFNASDFAFPSMGDAQIFAYSKQKPQVNSVKWFHSIEDSGTEWARFGEWDGGYVARIEDCADLIINPEQAQIFIDPLKPISETEKHTLLLLQGIPLLLQAMGEVVLHACSVVIEGRTVVVIGDAGAGKSTVAFQLSQRGHEVITEDALVLDQLDDKKWVPTQGPKVIKMRELATESTVLDFVGESFGKKIYSIVSSPLLLIPPISEIYFLNFLNEEFNVTPLLGIDSLRKLAKQLFRLKLDNEQFIKHELDVLYELVMSSRCFSVTYPHTKESLMQLVRRLEGKEQLNLNI